MSIINREQYMQNLQNLIGERDDEETLSMLADMTDTFDDMETRTSDSKEWEDKYNNLKQEYKERFFTQDSSNNSIIDEPDDEPEQKLTYEDLFKEM